jgi:hypothetical protein
MVTIVVGFHEQKTQKNSRPRLAISSCTGALPMFLGDFLEETIKVGQILQLSRAQHLSFA